MPGLSPRTQGFMQPPPGPEDAERAFEEGFSQMANSMLSGKFPELLESVQTFKVLATDLDTGSGVGAFVLSLNGTTLYVPAILASNQIKPMEIVFYKDKNIFLPLDKEWLDEIARNSIDELGEGVKPPDELEPDQDIRDVVIPPTVGRHVYASFPAPGEKLAQFLSDAPNRVKVAFRLVLEEQPRVLKFAFENFDRKMLVDAMRPHIEKTAAAPEMATILTTDDSADQFRKVFGKYAATAWQEAMKTGFVIGDQRESTNVAVEAEEPIQRVTAQESGFYEIHFQGGEVKKCLVISEPQPFTSPFYAGKRTDMRRSESNYWKTHRKTHDNILVDEYMRSEEPSHLQNAQTFLVYTEDGDIITTTDAPVGKWIPAEEIDGNLKKLVEDSQDIGTGYGFFYGFQGGKFQSTDPIDLLSITTGSDGVRRIKTSSGKVLVTDPKSPIQQMVAPAEGNVTYIPNHFRFVKGNYNNGALLQGADDTLSYCRELQKQGALKVKLIDAGASMFSIGGLEPQSKVATINSLMNDLELAGPEAKSLVEKTAAAGQHSFYLVNQKQMAKFAAWAKTSQGPAGMAPPPEMAGGMPPEGMPPEGMPPEGMPPEGMPPEAMAPPEPPPPSPIDMAAAEVEADLAQQSADLSEQIAEQQRDVANQMSAISAVKQRAEQIAMEQAGGPPAGPPGEVPQELPPGMAPEEGGMPPGGMPPGGMPPGGMPPEMAGGMPPEMAGGMPPGGMPPEMAGGMPPGGMPPEMAGGMPTEQPMSAEGMAGEAGPMMDQAAMLQDPEAFEATAIGSMATDADLRESVSTYLPNLEKALDNLGRILLALWMRESELRAELGESDFNDLEKRLQSVFTNMGGLILRINQTAMAAPEEDEGDEEA
jgi:hypothetical protein